MSNLIDRQVALDALEREKSLVERPITETRWFDLGLGKAQDVLSKLPSVEAEPTKRGKWFYDEIFDEYLVYRCSACNIPSDLDTPYCPWCGAKMDEHFEEPEINPCRGCKDYDGKGGCISNGGCGMKMDGGDENADKTTK